MRTIGALIESLKKSGKTVITITHDMQFVVNNFDRVVVMANRRLVADDDKRSIFWNQPVLDEANLKQPYLSELARDLDLDNEVLDLPEFVEAFSAIRTRH